MKSVEIRMRPDGSDELPRISLVSGNDLTWSVDSGNGVLTVFDNRNGKTRMIRRLTRWWRRRQRVRPLGTGRYT
jgi:hypothetical protein